MKFIMNSNSNGTIIIMEITNKILIDLNNYFILNLVYRKELKFFDLLFKPNT